MPEPSSLCAQLGQIIAILISREVHSKEAIHELGLSSHPLCLRVLRCCSENNAGVAQLLCLTSAVRVYRSCKNIYNVIAGLYHGGIVCGLVSQARRKG